MCARKFSLEDQTSSKKQDLGSPVQLTGWANQDETKSWTSNYFPKDDWISKDICILHSALFLLSSLESNNISTLHLPIFSNLVEETV